MCVVATVLGVVATAGAGGVTQATAQPHARAGQDVARQDVATVTGAVRFIVRLDPAVPAGRFAAALRDSGAELVEQ